MIYNNFLSNNFFKYFAKTDLNIAEKLYYIVSDTAKDLKNKYKWKYLESKNGK